MNIWVSAISAVAALAGAWGGQWIATRRDDRRWEREQRREDLRWEREGRRDLRDRRLRAYSDFLAAMRRLDHAVTRMHTAIVNRGRGADNEETIISSEHEVDAAYQDLSEKVAALELVSPQAIYKQVEENIREVSDLWGVLWDSWGAVSSTGGADLSDVIAKIKTARNKAWQAKESLTEQLRRHVDE